MKTNSMVPSRQLNEPADQPVHLNPCPFCGSKSLEIQEMTVWTGRTNRVLSYQIQHHCRGDIGNFIQVRGRTEDSLIAAWNSRYDGDDCRESGMEQTNNGSAE